MDAGGAADEGAVLRTAKSCGPDAPTLASSSREASFLGATVARKPGSPGRARRKPLKPLRGECRVNRCDRGNYARMLILFCMRGCGRYPSARHSLRPPFFGPMIPVRPGRESAAGIRSCIRSQRRADQPQGAIRHLDDVMADYAKTPIRPTDCGHPSRRGRRPLLRMRSSRVTRCQPLM
jgi:hypothetical protein